MSVELRERNIRIALPPGAKGRKFDCETHGLSHCMKAVDFIVELADRYLLIEIKDPDAPEGRAGDRDRWIQKFQSGNLDADLTGKYRDTFLYERASGRKKKPIYFLVLIAIETLTEADLLTRTDALKRAIPFDGPSSGVWTRKIIDGCGVFNIRAWNQALPQLRASRI